MLFRKKICIPLNTSIPNILPKGLHRHDLSDYLLSKTFQRRFGEEFARREVLLLAASAALIALPVRPARALSADSVIKAIQGTIECGVSGLQLLDEYFQVRKHISGEAEAKNEEGHSQNGTMMLCIFDQDGTIELSDGRKFSIPRYTTAKFTFQHGPAPQEPGSKTFAVASAIDADTVDFEAQG